MKRFILASALVLALSTMANAQTRLAAFALNCDGKASGVASFTLFMEHNVFFQGQSCWPIGTPCPTALLNSPGCTNGKSNGSAWGLFPNIPDSAGNLVKATVAVKTDNAAGKKAYCDLTTTNGFLNGTCMTDTSNNGPIDAVHVLISIPNLP